MSGIESGALPAQPDEAQISSLVSSIVLRARESDSLSSLTPRLVRSEVENRLGLPSGTLDLPAYKSLVKHTIQDAMQREQTSRVGGKISRNASKLKAGKGGHSSVSKSISSKEIITDSELEDGPGLSVPQRKAEPSMKPDNREEEKRVRSKTKTTSSKADPKTSKGTSSSTKAAHLGSKRKLPPEPRAQSDSATESSNKTPKVSSSSRRITDNQKSDSELSSLLDEPSKKKARGKFKNSEAGKPRVKSKRSKQTSHTLSKDEENIKRLKSLVVACGVRKQWTRELDGLNTSAQIAHIRKILSDLGMAGRLSMEQAREIRAQRELAQELDDVQRFERAVVSGKPFKSESTNRRLAKTGSNADNDSSEPGSESEFADHEPPKMNNARRSIMAFLQDQSSDDE